MEGKGERNSNDSKCSSVTFSDAEGENLSMDKKSEEEKRSMDKTSEEENRSMDKKSEEENRSKDKKSEGDNRSTEKKSARENRFRDKKSEGDNQSVDKKTERKNRSSEKKAEKKSRSLEKKAEKKSRSLEKKAERKSRSLDKKAEKKKNRSPQKKDEKETGPTEKEGLSNLTEENLKSLLIALQNQNVKREDKNVEGSAVVSQKDETEPVPATVSEPQPVMPDIGQEEEKKSSKPALEPEEKNEKISHEESESDLAENSESLMLKKTDKMINFQKRILDYNYDDDGNLVGLDGEFDFPEKIHSPGSEKVEMHIVNEKGGSKKFVEVVGNVSTVQKQEKAIMESIEDNAPDTYLSKKFFLRNLRQAVNYYFKKKDIAKRSKHTQSRFKDENLKAVEDSFFVSEVPEEEDLRIKRHIRDMYLYFLFTVVLLTIALGMVSSSMYYFSNVTAHVFMDTPNNGTHALENVSFTAPFRAKNLRQITTIEDFWEYAETTMISLLYWDFFNTKIDPLLYTGEKKMFYENQILGVARIRQVRVRDDSCEIHPDMKRFFDKCYNFYSIFSEETRPIKEGMEDSVTATAWTYTEAAKLQTSLYIGDVSIYGGGGYYIDLGVNKESALTMLHQLRDNTWISIATRAIFIDFNIYNANVNLFCICKIVLEFPPVGGVISKADFVPLKLIRYLDAKDYVLLACELFLLVFTLYFTFIEKRAIENQEFGFFSNIWNYIDVCILVLLYICMGLNMARYLYLRKFLGELLQRDNAYSEFDFIKNLQVTYNNIIASVVFLCLMKYVQYINYNKQMVEFSTILYHSMKNMVKFFPIFIIMFLAFTFIGYLLFGNQVKDYHTFWLSAMALLQIFTGKFEYKQIQESHLFLGPLFYVIYIFFMIFLMLNMFVAIVIDTYTNVKAKVNADEPKVSKYLNRAVLNLFGSCGMDKMFMSKTTTKQKTEYRRIIQTLRRAGFSDIEIKIFFSKYDINIYNVFNIKTKRRLIQDLEVKTLAFNETQEQLQLRHLRRKVDDLRDKIEDMEISLRPVIDKVDVLLRRQ